MQKKSEKDLEKIEKENSKAVGFTSNKELTILLDDESDDDNSIDSNIQITKPKPKLDKISRHGLHRLKKPRSEKQIEQFKKACEIREQKRQERKSKKEEDKEQQKIMLKQKEDEIKERIKKEMEEKIVKKAISIKKKQIKKEVVLDEISDDDTPIEQIKKMRINKKECPPPKIEIPKPKYYFV